MKQDRHSLRLGVIGCGHWGPNHIRVFSELDGSVVVACADPNEATLSRMAGRFPLVRGERDYRSLLDRGDIDAVVIATPVESHAAIAAEALQAGKHVLLEKPMCLDSCEATALVALAESSGLVLMIGHVFLFNDGIMKLREMVGGGTLGRIHYLDAVRTNLGPIRGDVNALYDLGTHDISIFNYLLDAVPIAVSAIGSRISQASVEDVCFASLKYPDGTLAHIHVSWLNPRKVRTLTIVGEQQMAHWDDVDPSDTLRLYDKGLAEPPRYDSFGEFQYLMRSGDVHLPAIRRSEPLQNQGRAFLEWVASGTRQGPDARDGLAVAQILDAATRSMREDGAMVPVAQGESHDVRPVSAPRESLHPSGATHEQSGMAEPIATPSQLVS